jgi:hypothetical protein
VVLILKPGVTEARFYHDVLIRCQSYHGDYACSGGGVATSGSDEMDPNTRVPTVRCTWVPVLTSYHARH